MSETDRTTDLKEMMLNSRDIIILKETVTELKTDYKNIQKEVTALETNARLFDKDLEQVREVILSLKESVDNLVKELGNLKIKPLEKYEKITIIIISAVVGVLAGRFL